MAALDDLLQGKPFGQPLHPALVHFPIALFVFSLLLDVGSYVLPDGDAFVLGAFFAMLCGVVTALVAALPGLVDWSDIRNDHPAKKTATTHMLLNIALVALYVVNLLLRSSQLEATATPVFPLLFSLAGVGILSISGYLGGTLVYDDGIAVGRHRRRTPTPRKTIAVRGQGKGDGFVPVAAASSLGDGETLRVAVDGVVMTIARVGGDYVAFQEFCPHRYGPLSAGALRDGEIECPWHRSRFDVRSGKVTQGPAKSDLQTFDVAVRDGAILVRAPAWRLAAPGSRV